MAVLVVSFGTSYRENLDLTIGAIEAAIAEAFPDCSVYRAFTSRAVTGRLKERYGLDVDSVEEALERAAGDGIEELAVQPTHLLDGYDYMVLKKTLKNYERNFSRAAVGEPLLSSVSDFDAVVKVMAEMIKAYDDGETAVCFMGHGTETDGNNVYARMQDRLKKMGYEYCYIGTMEARPSLEDVLNALEGKTYKKIILRPLMVVSGHHAHREMAGSKDGSWKSVLESRGYEVRCIMEGLGQIPAVRDIYVNHVRAAMKNFCRPY